MMHCIDGVRGFITLHQLLKTFGAIESDVRKVEMVYIQEECVVYVKHIQPVTAMNYIIDHADIV